MPYTYEYPHPAVTVDIAVFTFVDGRLKVMLIRRGREPFRGMWALPGGFVEIDESLRRAAWRELKEETGVHAAFLEQFGAFGQPNRDPRERVISIGYYALIPAERLHIRAGSDASDARLFDMDALPELATDHPKIVARAIARVRERIDDPVIALQLLPESFTLTELQQVFEQVRGSTLDKRNFRKRILALDLVAPTGGKRRGGAHRPAALYRVKNRSDVPFRQSQSPARG